MQHVRVAEVARDGVVQVGGKLTAPAVEVVVEQTDALGPDDRQGAVVAGPSVVGGALGPAYAVVDAGRQTLPEQGLHGLTVGRHDEKRFAQRNLVGQADVAFRHLGQHRRPVGPGVRPRQLDAALRVPFRRQHGLHERRVVVVTVAAAEEAVQVEVGAGRGRRGGKERHGKEFVRSWAVS